MKLSVLHMSNIMYAEGYQVIIFHMEASGAGEK